MISWKGDDILEGLRIDDSALHPDLRSFTDASGYYSLLSKRTEQLKSLIKRSIKLDHELFLLSNTTQALMVAAYGLRACGIALDCRRAGYKNFQRFPYCDPATNDLTRIELRTHIDPNTGKISSLNRVSDEVMVVDAAQSIGAIAHHQQLSKADIISFPLHKHLGLAAGLGVLAIKDTPELHTTRRAAAIAQQGTKSLSTINAAILNYHLNEGRVFNRVIFNCSSSLYDELKIRNNVEIVTPEMSSTPFICLRGPGIGACAKAALSAGLSVKFFKNDYVIRISGSKRGYLDDPPIDFTPIFVDSLCDNRADKVEHNHEQRA